MGRAVLSADDGSSSPFSDDSEPSPRDQERAALPPWKIAIVDDQQEVHDVTRLALGDVTFSGRRLAFLSAYSGHAARELLAAHPDVALVLVDVVMESDHAGLELVRYIRGTLANPLVRLVLRTGQPGQAPEARVIREYDVSDYRSKTELTATRLLTTVISALRTFEQLSAVEAQRQELARLCEAQQRSLEEIARLTAELERERDYLREEVVEAAGGDEVIGVSPAFVRVLGQVDIVARSEASVLILGESGVGKEVIARAIHERSPRARKPLVKVNCASVPRELFESEFFGHVRGSFTGAHRDRVGRFQLADGGTLFLDEVGEIPIELQGKLLRALQEGEVERVGEAKAQLVDVRIIAATNRDLRKAIEEGRFRADLYYRLNVFPLAIPPLRLRREDIVPLFEHALARACRKYRRPFRPLSPAQVRVLEAYPWPGNVRELQNVVERAVLLSHDGVLRLEEAIPELAQEAAASEAAPPVDPAPGTPATSTADWRAQADERGFYTVDELRRLERESIQAALVRAGGKVAGKGGAAELLGMKPSTLSYQMRSLGVVAK